MLVITVDASSQAPYRSFPCKHENSFIPLLLLFPKSLATFREPCFQSLMPFSPNIVPAQESHRSVAVLRRHKLHITRPAVNGRSRSFRCASSPLKIFDFAGTPFFGGESWHGHILFGRSFSFLLKWHFHLFGQIEKADLHEPLAERIEIPFQSKKSCKSALLQSRSLFVRRPVNRLKTLGRRRRLIAAEALVAAYQIYWMGSRSRLAHSWI